MKRLHYTFAYSGEWEGMWRFYKLARLLKFLQKVPPHELKRTQCHKIKGGYAYAGAYFVKKRGGLSVRF